MKKSIISLIIVCCLVLALGVISTQAETYTGSCGTNVTYSLDSGVLTISGTGAMKDYTYSSKAPWCSYESYIKSIVIFDGVESIGEYAFYQCISLTSVTIGEGVKSIGYAAFGYCEALTEINWNARNVADFSSNNSVFYNAGQDGEGIKVVFGDKVEKIPAYCFKNRESSGFGIPKIKSVTIGNSVTSIGDSAFIDCSGLTSVTIGNSVTSIGDSAFDGCSSLTSVTIGNSVTSIGDSAFEGCRGLTSVTIPDSVTSIGACAFQDCSSLTNVTIGDSVTSIGIAAFDGCSSLTSVTIPDSVTSIGNYAFDGCSSLTEIIVDKNNAYYCSLDGVLFNKDKTILIQYPIGKTNSTYTIPDSVTSIGGYAFQDCSSLTNVTIPDSVTSIGGYAFYYCSSLTSVTIPDSVTSIGNYAFDGCSSLTSVTIPDSVTSIGNHAFRGCSSLTSIEIPDSVTSIGWDTFRGCSSLTSVTIPDSVTSIGIAAFDGCSSLTSVTIPDSVTSIGNNAFYGCSSLTSVIIPDSVTSIGSDAFRGCSGLTSVTIPDSVTSIGTRTFQDCSSLTSVTIPDSVTSIGIGAFNGCSSLTDVYYGGTQEEWNAISINSNGNTPLTNANMHYAKGECGENATFKVENDGTLTISGSGAMADYAAAADMPWADYADQITKIVIEDGVTTVGARAFYGLSNVTEVEIADSVTAINTNAFRNCTSLTKISLPADVTELGTYAFSGCSALARVDIGSKVESIGNFAFYNCKALTDVYFDGTQAEWEDVSVGNFNTGLTSATIHCKAAATVTIDGVSADYNTIADAIAAADNAGKAVDIKLLVAAGEVAIEPVYAHTIDLNGYTVDTFAVTGDVNLTNGTVTMLNVTGIVKCENVAVTGTNAVSYGSEGTKSVYTAYGIGANVVDGAQVRIGNGLVNGTIDAESGLRFIGQADMNDTLAGAIVENYYTYNAYTTGYAIGIEISAQDSDKKAYITATKWQDDSIFTAAVTGLYANNFNRNYTARAYVEYDGVKIFESGSTTRSMYAVASGLLMSNRATTEELLNVLNAYVNQTGVRLTLTKENEFSARMSGQGAYTGEAFFTVGETMYEEGMYMVTLTPIGQAKIDVDLFNSYVRINNNNSLVSPATFIMDNEDGTYTIVFDYSSL